MKRAYWLLVLLAVWCTACAIWYMRAVKGIPSEPEYFHPQPVLIAIAEICLMILFACLIGYGIGSSVRGQNQQEFEDAIQELERDKASLIGTKQDLEDKVETGQVHAKELEVRLSEVQAEAKRNEEDHLLQHEQLQKELTNTKSAQSMPSVSEETENELKTLRYRVLQLDYDNKELNTIIARLQEELDDSKNDHQHQDVEPSHPFVRPVTEDERDDLTMIKGIGPFIEKRLNMIGVFTFKQISEFTPEIMEQVSRAIEFFPKRMERDDWVGQAKRLVSAE